MILYYSINQLQNIEDVLFMKECFQEFLELRCIA